MYLLSAECVWTLSAHGVPCRDSVYLVNTVRTLSTHHVLTVVPCQHCTYFVDTVRPFSTLYVPCQCSMEIVNTVRTLSTLYVPCQHHVRTVVPCQHCTYFDDTIMYLVKNTTYFFALICTMHCYTILKTVCHAQNTHRHTHIYFLLLETA